MNSKLLALEAQVKSLNSEAEVARRNEKLLADEIDSKIKVMSKLSATVDDLQSKLDVEQENIVDRDRTISSLRAELEESNRKLEYLQTKHGHQDNGSLTVSGRTRDRLRDFTSDSGVETNEDDAATVISDNAEEDQGAASTSPSATGRLKTQLAAAQSRIAALETELRIAGGGSRSPDGGNSADYPDVRNAMNAGMREVIVEREKLKVQLENEIEKRKDLENQLKESQVDVPKLRRMDTNDSNLDDSGRRLQRQLKEAIEDFDALKSQREEELSLLRQLYNDLPNPDSNAPSSLPRFSVDALISRVDRLKSDKESLVDRILDLQSKNESLNGKLDFLMHDSKSSGDVSLLQNELDDVRYNLRKTEQQLQDALSDLSKFQSDNKQLLSELDYSKNKETKLTNEISAVRDEYEALLKEQISSGQSLREQMNRSQSSSSEQLKVLESQLKAEYSRDKNALEARLREAEDLNDRLKLDLKSLENDFQESRKAVQELEGKLFDRERELKELDRETRDIDERYRSMKSDYDAVKLDLSQVKRRYEDQLEEKADLIERLKREIDAVKREAQESTSLYSTSKSQVESQIKDLRDKLEDRESELKRTGMRYNVLLLTICS
ncbi:hypothetical protein BKA69DRAFT_311066 [Paraphysoderma sedebokerense]|nr:hypothetical protein BKA69DRAFT_311066 [Paraphysoderma sedebokerense]